MFLDFSISCGDSQMIIHQLGRIGNSYPDLNSYFHLLLSIYYICEVRRKNRFRILLHSTGRCTMKTWNTMTPIEKYTQLLNYADCGIVNIEDALDRKLALGYVKRALMYALFTHAVPRDEALRSAEHRRAYIRQHYADVPAARCLKTSCSGTIKCPWTSSLKGSTRCTPNGSERRIRFSVSFFFYLENFFHVILDHLSHFIFRLDKYTAFIFCID